MEPFRCFSGLLALPLPFKTVCFFIVTFGAVETQIVAFKILECPSHCMLRDGVCCDSIATVYDASAIKLDIDSTMAIRRILMYKVFRIETSMEQLEHKSQVVKQRSISSR